MASGDEAVAVEVIPGPSVDTAVPSGFVDVEFDDFSDTFSREATVDVPACGTPPPEPPDAAGVVLSGVAVCAAETGQSTITWTLANDSGGSLHAIGERIFGVDDQVVGLASGDEAVAVEVIPGPSVDTAVPSGFVNVEFDDFSDTFSREATVDVPACGTPPPEPPDAAGVVLSGVAVCAAETGQSTITWTLANDSGGSLHAIGERIFGVDDQVVGLASGDEAVAVEVIPGPSVDTAVPSGFVARRV